MSNIVPKLRQLYHTPLRDMARLRLSGRLDWKTTIADSGLPVPIRQLIAQIVGKSWLFRYEQASVAEELVAHFQDGHRSGQSYEQLLRDFGDPKTAAQLILRGKRRNRPLWFAVARALAAGCALLIAGLIGIYCYFYFATTRPSINYVALLNEPIAKIDAAEKAWPVYRQAWGKYGVSETDFAPVWIYDDLQPGDDQWPDVIKLLDSKSGLLNSLRFAGELPVFGLELKSEFADYDGQDLAVLYPGTPPTVRSTKPTEEERIENALVMAALLPHVSLLHISARLVVHDSVRAIEEGDSIRALKNIQTLYGMSRQVSDTPFAVCGLTALSFNDFARDLIETIVIKQPGLLSDQQLKELIDTVDRQNIAGLFNYAGNQMACSDIVQRMFTDDGDGNGRLTLQTFQSVTGMFTRETREAMGPVASWRMALIKRQQVQSMFDRFFESVDASFHVPYYEHRPSYESILRQITADTDAGRFVSFFVGESYDHLRSAVQRQMGIHQGLRIGLAIEEYRRKTGDWPGTLEQLVPDFITELPVDPVTGQPLKFRTVAGRPLVYSVGLDLTDDGGEALKYPPGFQSDVFTFTGPVGVTGDWMLWPNK